MDLVNDKAENYAKKFTSPLGDLLASIEAETLALHAHPHMISGHVQGKFLEMISQMIKPARVLEIGSFTGFSAICLAKGLQTGGELHTIELREDDANTCRKNFLKAGLNETIKLHVGDAKTIIPTLNATWDLVFIDADKTGYIEYYELTLPQLKSGGFILADNVLFHGEVLKEEVKGKNALAIQAFNEHVAKDNRVEQLIITMRDGMLLARKK